MTTKIDLPDGGWASLLTPAELTNRQRKTLRRHAIPAYKTRDKFEGADSSSLFDRVTADDMDLMSDMQAAYIVVYLAEWSLDRDLPTMDTVDDLPGPIFDALAKATTRLGIGSVKVDVDDAANPASPTVPSPA